MRERGKRERVIERDAIYMGRDKCVDKSIANIA